MRKHPKNASRKAKRDWLMLTAFLHCLVLREHKSLKLDLLAGLYQRQGQAYLENYTEDKMKENHRRLQKCSKDFPNILGSQTKQTKHQ